MDPYRIYAQEKYPLAAADGRIHGEGKFALIGCGDRGTRHLHLFETQEQRNKVLWRKWDVVGCGQSGCNGNHILKVLELPVATEPVAYA